MIYLYTLPQLGQGSPSPSAYLSSFASSSSSVSRPSSSSSGDRCLRPGACAQGDVKGRTPAQEACQALSDREHSLVGWAAAVACWGRGPDRCTASLTVLA